MMLIVLCPKTGPGDGYLSCVGLRMTLTTDPLGQMSTGGRPKGGCLRYMIIVIEYVYSDLCVYTLMKMRCVYVRRRCICEYAYMSACKLN